MADICLHRTPNERSGRYTFTTTKAVSYYTCLVSCTTRWEWDCLRITSGFRRNLEDHASFLLSRKIYGFPLKGL